MTKVDPIIAVKDVEASSKWYQNVFDFRSLHGGREFDVITSPDQEVMLCLHRWGDHEHPTMQDPNLTPGNGLILYFRTENLEQIRNQLRSMNYDVISEIQVNPNSRRKEFSLKDPDGYFLIVSEFHQYEG